MKDIYNNNIEIYDIVLCTINNTLKEGIVTQIINENTAIVNIDDSYYELNTTQCFLKEHPNFFITMIEKIEKENQFTNFGKVRCVGYTETLEEAVESLNQNWHNANLFQYNFAIVEKIYPGAHQVAKEKIFFIWDPNRYGYYEIPELNETKQYYNFSLG